MVNEAIKKQVLELSDKERAELAHLLIDSLNPVNEFESEEAWQKELKDRISRYEQGVSSTKSWSEVKRKGQRLINK
ncbi:MAG TPA: addiction module protein [Balneolales bacterium]|nr:addiction module protein [Balneolales bacterium]